jgi:hypothetical protein
MSREHQWNDTDRKKTEVLGETCPSATLSATNYLWSGLGFNMGHWDERLVTNCLRKLPHLVLKIKVSTVCLCVIP